MKSRPLWILSAVCTLAELSLGSVTASAQNLLTDLGPDSGVGINNSGQVALKNSLYSNGTLTPYPAGSINGQTQTFTGAAINASGQVAGLLFFHAALYSNGLVTDLCNICYDASVASSSASGINDSGTVVGWADIDGGETVDGVIIAAGTVTDIGALEPGRLFSVRSEARAINDNGVVTGDAYQEVIWNVGGVGYHAEGPHAVLYGQGTLTDLFPGIGYAINASGQIAGRTDDISTGTQIPAHAFLYQNGTSIDLGTLAGGATSVGYAINSAGQVVGASDLAGSSGTHAFFYNGAIQDMNALVSATDPLQPFVALTDAHGINDSRLIVVNGIDSRTQLQHAYLLQGPWLDVAPGPLSFPSQAIGTVSSAQSVSLTNSGLTLMTLGALSTSGDFSQINNCGTTLAASGSCTVLVTFGPTAAGDRTGALTVISAGVPITVPLAGISPIQMAISSSAATTTTGAPIKLTWTASPGASCTATGGSTTDGWADTVAPSGTQSVTESTAGTYLYGLSCTLGSQSQSNQTSVIVTWPLVLVSLTAIPASFMAGQSLTLKWTSANATSCSATGGGGGDTWPGAKATNGSATLTEPSAPVSSSLTLTYTLTCTSSVSGLSTTASAQSVENAIVTPSAATTSGGGGGALDPWAVLFLTAVAALRLGRHGTKLNSTPSVERKTNV